MLILKNENDLNIFFKGMDLLSHIIKYITVLFYDNNII